MCIDMRGYERYERGKRQSTNRRHAKESSEKRCKERKFIEM